MSTNASTETELVKEAAKEAAALVADFPSNIANPSTFQTIFEALLAAKQMDKSR